MEYFRLSLSISGEKRETLIFSFFGNGQEEEEEEEASLN